MIAVAAFLGAFTWTFLEYVLHRFLGHVKGARKNPFGKEHVRHHAEGDYFAPSWKKLAIALAFTGLLCAPAVAIAGAARGVAYVLGLMSFYGAYEVLHRLLHVSEGIGPYGRWARRHHFHHHFVDPRTNHGVTSPLWDVVFGAYRKPSVIKVPPRLRMRWLERGVPEAYADTFVIGATR